MKASAHALLGVVTALVSASCGVPTTTGADFDPDFDFSPYGSFTFDEAQDRTSGDPRLEDNPFFEDLLHQAVERELASRGIRRASDAPMLRVHHHVSVQDHVEVYEADPESGAPLSDYGPGTEVIQYEEGMFIVHIVDTDKDETVWIGWARGDVGTAIDDRERMREWVDEAVSEMFEHFPAS